MKVIKFFIREEPYGFLSNYERTPITIMVRWGTVTYPTNEHYYQAQKANCEEVHDWIAWAPHARLAMVMGRELEHNKYLKDKFMVKNWESKKISIMLQGLEAKFKNPKLRKMLLDTGDAILHEDNPEDPFWGIGDGSGESWLGKLLMQVRDEIRKDGGQEEMESIKEKMKTSDYPVYDKIGYVNADAYWTKRKIEEIEKSGVTEELEEARKRYAHYKKIQDEYYQNDLKNGGV